METKAQWKTDKPPVGITEGVISEKIVFNQNLFPECLGKDYQNQFVFKINTFFLWTSYDDTIKKLLILEKYILLYWKLWKIETSLSLYTLPHLSWPYD